MVNADGNKGTPPVIADDVTSLLMVGIGAVMAALDELSLYNREGNRPDLDVYIYV